MTTKIFYPKVDSLVNFPKIEEKIIAYWEKEQIFQKSVDNRPAIKDGVNNEFIFYDGPPFANGLPHYGHLLTGYIKDLYARYQTSLGKRVERKFGWDCHGLPAEMGAEKDLGISGRLAILDYGMDKFNDHCRESVMKYSNDWEKYVSRQARWVDFTNGYKTMDTNFMESVIWAFSELHKKGLIYESMRVMPYSWACETSLSNFETRLDNSYRERTDKAITVSFNLTDQLKSGRQGIEYKILAWTTTPWTLPSNLALAIGKAVEYVIIEKENIGYILAKSALSKYAGELNFTEESIIHPINAEELIGARYKPLFPYFENHANAFKILTGEFVTEGDGTGVVHMAPGFGEDDQLLCAESNIELVCPVDNAGCFTSEVSDYAGLQVFAANDKIIKKLKIQGNWLKTEQYIHNYPHCWRTDTPLIYKAVPSFYVKVTAIKDRMVELNQQINWIPGNVKDGLFGKWLQNARDWSISRNRFWGTPLPVWKSDDLAYPRTDIYGSIKELEEDFKVKVTDLHRPFIDSLTRPNPDDPTGKSMMCRVDDVFDCWFESGSMPYGQVHYPFEKNEWFENHFPADFIVEYSAQTRGWFYTLMVLSTALFDRPPFLNCICHGVILDSTGQKLSKRLNNYADPLELFNQYGSDALRATMLSTTVVKGQELLIDKEGKMVYDTLRLTIKPIWNAYHFFTLYANADQLIAEENYDSTNVLDRYILSKLKLTIQAIKLNLDNFDSQNAYIAVSNFFEILNNLYIRRSRNRFWKSELDIDKSTAYNTLFTCLKTMTCALAPLLPLIAEEIYLGLNAPKAVAGIADSVHLQDFPNIDFYQDDQDLVNTMDIVRDICSAALFVRSSENIRTRQPLAELKIVTSNNIKLSDFENLIMDEVNVKSITYHQDLENYASLKLSINFPVLGKRIPGKIKEIIMAVKNNAWQQTAGQLRVAEEILLDEEYNFVLEPKDFKGAKALANNFGIIILDLEISESLKEEGLARDLVRLIQQARKDCDFNITDRIEITILAPEAILNIGQNFKNFIREQTLCEFIAVNDQGAIVSEVKLGEDLITLKMYKRS